MSFNVGVFLWQNKTGSTDEYLRETVAFIAANHRACDMTLDTVTWSCVKLSEAQKKNFEFTLECHICAVLKDEIESL